MTVLDRFHKTHPTFQASISALSEKYGKPCERIYEWWLKYCQACRDFDQSPVLFEFENWYAADLKA